MANTFNLIGNITAGAGGATDFTFSSIPATYTDLKIVGSTRVTDTGEGTNPPISRGRITYNGSGGLYSVCMLYGLPGQSPSANTAGGSNSANSFYATSSVSTGSVGTLIFSSFEIYIPSYRSSLAKVALIQDVTENYADPTTEDSCAILWNGTAAITSIKLNPLNNGTYAQYSTVSLYGISNS